jgi:hypothetical protein
MGDAGRVWVVQKGCWWEMGGVGDAVSMDGTERVRVGNGEGG